LGFIWPPDIGICGQNDFVLEDAFPATIDTNWPICDKTSNTLENE